MQTVHLDTKYSNKIDQAFTIGSLLQNRLSKENDFVGAKTVRIHNINTVPFVDYDRGAASARYGTPTEVGDTVQELTLTQDKSFSGVIDKGNNLDQCINKAGKFLGVQMSEAVIPEYDRYCFEQLCHKAGKIVGSAQALDASNVMKRLSAARTHFLNHKVPTNGRTLYISTNVFQALVETDAFKNLDKIGTKAIVNGQVGEIFGAPVVEVPEDLLPAGVNFILVHKRAACAPEKIHDAKTHIDPPGISGSLVEGRFYYDLFVYAHKSNGVYVDVTTTSNIKVLGNVTISATGGAISGEESGATVIYTTDGTDPRYSVTAAVGKTPKGGAGVIVKAYQKKDGYFASGVVTQKLTS